MGLPVRGQLSVVRPATDEDVDLLVAWHADPEVSRYWDDETFTPEQMRERLEREPVDAWIIESGGEPIGYLQSWWEEEGPRRGGLDGFLLPDARARPDAGRGPRARRIATRWGLAVRDRRPVRMERARAPWLGEGRLRRSLSSRCGQRAQLAVGFDAVRVRRS